MGKKGGSFRERLSSQRGRIQRGGRDGESSCLEWADKRNTAWTDESRLGNQRVGCAVVVVGRSRRWHNTTNHPKSTARSTAQTARERWTEDDIVPLTEERAAYGTRALETMLHHHLRSPARPMDRGWTPFRNKQRDVRRRIVCHLLSSHAVRKTA